MAQEAPDADFKLADGHGYMLARSHVAACRLNLQHYLWREVLKFTIHPSISLPEDPVIADVAAGTGLWLLDAAREHPTAQLDGLNIDLTQAPHPQWLPANIHLRQWNLFDPVPTDLIGKYDFVHVRLLVMVLSGLDAQPVIRNLFQMLKPGGYLQWDELDCVNMHVKKVDPSVSAPAIEELCAMSYADGRHDWTLQLPESFARCGFEDAKLEYYGDEIGLARAFSDQHLLTMTEFAESLHRIGKDEAAAKFYRLVSEGCQESARGAAFCIPRIVCVARKPS